MVVPVPHGAVEPVAVLGQPCEIEDAEVAAPRGPVAVVRRRFAEVVEARPDKLPDGPGIVVLHHKVVVGQIAPRTVVYVVAVTLPAGAVHRVVGHGGEVVDTARTECRSSLRPQHEALRESLPSRLPAVQAVVEPGDVERRYQSRPHGVVHHVHALGHRPCRVEAMAQRHEMTRLPGAPLRRLIGYLVAYAPHHDAGVIAVVEQQVGDVLIAPLVEEQRIAVPAFGVAPHVEALGHHHHAQRVAEVHLHGGGHVVRGPYRVASHLLEELYLPDEGGPAYCGAQGPEVVVQADASDLAALPVELKSELAAHADGPDAEAQVLGVDGPPVVFYPHLQRVEMRLLGRPQPGLHDGERGAQRVGEDIVAARGEHLPSPLIPHRRHPAYRPLRALCEPRCDLHRGPAALYRLGSDECPPVVYGQRAAHLQPHGAVEARAGIPAAALLAVSQAHLDSVVALPQQACDVYAERVVSVGPPAGRRAVDIHVRFAHRAVEAQHGALRHSAQRHGAAVVAPAYPRQAPRAPRDLRGLRLAVLHDGHGLHVPFLVKRAADGPVVRHGHLLKVHTVARELPVPEFRLPALGLREPGRQGHAQQYRDSSHVGVVRFHNAKMIKNCLNIPLIGGKLFTITHIRRASVRPPPFRMARLYCRAGVYGH